MRYFIYKMEYDDIGNVIHISKLNNLLEQDEEMFIEIAPYVRESPYIEMTGEDYSIWRWVFEEGSCKEIIW